MEKNGQRGHMPIPTVWKEEQKASYLGEKRNAQVQQSKRRRLLSCYFLLPPYLEALGSSANFLSRQNSFDKQGLNVFVLEECF